MSLFNIFNVTGSAMSAQSVRLNTTASNLANANSVSSSIDETYRARNPVFATALADAQGDYRGNSLTNQTQAGQAAGVKVQVADTAKTMTQRLLRLGQG